ncbi:MAG TPA: hypothetical protein VN622_14245 [Clostridia bacterium]|nr:hypothetical protein [Clostridia bacterium]
MRLTLLNLRETMRAGDVHQVFATSLTTLNLTLDESLTTKPEDKVANTQQALNPQLLALGDSEDARSTRITSSKTRRDLNPLMHEKMQQVCYYLSSTTPFGKRIVEIITSFVVGEGFDVIAKDQRVQDVVKRFWTDGINDIEKNLSEYSDELSRFGELCLPVAVNPVDGMVRLGYIDPQDIDCIEYGRLQTQDGDTDISFPVAVRLKQRMFEKEPRRLRIVRLDEDSSSESFGQLVGDCFYFAVNKSKSASRGISDLFCLADWIDVLDQMIFDFADKVRLLNSFIWDVTLNGADQKAVDEYTRKLTKNPPRQGGVQVHNEGVKFETRTPDFKGADMAESAQMVKKYGLGGIGLPPMFFADPVDANRSTAAEMEGPTGKKLTERQNVIKRIVRALVNFVIDQAIAHGVLPEDVDRGFDIQAPDLLIRDMQKSGATLAQTGSALALAEDRGWIQGETAARAFHIMLSQLGVKVESKDEYAAAQLESSNKQAQQIDELNPQVNLKNALDLAAGAGGVQ